MVINFTNSLLVFRIQIWTPKDELQVDAVKVQTYGKSYSILVAILAVAKVVKVAVQQRTIFVIAVVFIFFHGISEVSGTLFLAATKKIGPIT